MNYHTSQHLKSSIVKCRTLHSIYTRNCEVPSAEFRETGRSWCDNCNIISKIVEYIYIVYLAGMSDITHMITVNVYPSPKGRRYSLTSAYLFVGQTEDGRHYHDISLTWLHQLMRVLDGKNYKDMSVSLVTVLSLLFKSPAAS